MSTRTRTHTHTHTHTHANVAGKKETPAAANRVSVETMAPDVGVVISLNRFWAPVDDTVTAHPKTQVTSHKSQDSLDSLCAGAPIAETSPCKVDAAFSGAFQGDSSTAITPVA